MGQSSIRKSDARVGEKLPTWATGHVRLVIGLCQRTCMIKSTHSGESDHNLQVSNMGKIKAAAAGIGAYEVGKHAHHHHEKHEAKKHHH